MDAIIPAAGRGTRMASITGGAPKELLKLGRQSILERVVREALEAGAEDVLIINSPEKPQIDEVAQDLGASVILQTEMRGLGHAVSLGARGNDALILLGDCVFEGGSPSTRMANLLSMGIDGVIAVETVPDEEVHRYGIAEVDDMGTIRRLIEKPQPDETSSRYAVAARYALSARLLTFVAEHIEANLNRRSGELNLTEPLELAIRMGLEIKAVALQPGQARVDCGTPEEYAAARRLPWN